MVKVKLRPSVLKNDASHGKPLSVYHPGRCQHYKGSAQKLIGLSAIGRPKLNILKNDGSNKKRHPKVKTLNILKNNESHCQPLSIDRLNFEYFEK